MGVKSGSTYNTLFEEQDSSVWQIGLAIASTAAGPYTVSHFPITSLDADGQDSRGGPWFYEDSNSTYHLWYHGNYYAASGLPNRIFKTTSTDLINWTTPELVVNRSSPYDYDAVANPRIALSGIATPSGAPDYLLFCGGDNSTNLAAKIFIARPGVMPVTP